MLHKSLAPLLVTALLLILPPALYVGSYCLLATTGYTNYGVRVGSYRYGGSAAEWFFRPLELTDRKLRPEQWVPLCVSPAEPS